MAGSRDAAGTVMLGDYFLSGELVGQYPEAYEFLLRYAELRTAAAAANKRPKLKTPAREWRKLIERNAEFRDAVENARRDFDETMASSLFIRCAAGAPITRRWDNRTTLELLTRVAPDLVGGAGGGEITADKVAQALARGLQQQGMPDADSAPSAGQSADAPGPAVDAPVDTDVGPPDADGARAEPGAVQDGSGGPT